MWARTPTLQGVKKNMWYREGTVTFTKGSDTISGIGTRWNLTENGVLPGMIVIGPDNKLYEVKRVRPEWRGYT